MMSAMSMFAELPWSDWDAAAWSAVGVWFTAGIYVVLAFFAWSQVREAVRLRRDQTRPFVMVNVTPRADGSLMLSVTNLGRSQANDVRLKFTPPLDSTISRPWPWEESPLFTEGHSNPPSK
jgi:hypothetical protein